ncbi:MAG: endo-1,4-beta-xylanase [Oscillospiraceae bacterium]|nr:endo-1,4-beta-xylanase [Oscillospiraceae bacterium]
MKWKRVSAVLTAAACSAAMLSTLPVSLAEAAVCVSNDFEFEYEGWYSTSDAASLTAVKGIGYGGSRGMLVSGRTAPQDGAASSKGFFLHGGTNYNYSVQVYSETDETFRLTLLTKDIDSGEPVVKELAVKQVKAGQWATLTASDRAAANSGEFNLTITTDSTNDFRFDNLQITTHDTMLVAEAADLGLKDEFAPYFRVGNILNGSTVNDTAIKNILLKDCNAIECENETKPDATLKSVNGTSVSVGFNSGASAILDWASKNHIAFRGHTLVWHSQTPESFFKQNGSWVDKNTMDQRMENYIKAMFDAYKTQYPGVNLYAYDVCNECISDDAGACNNGDGARSPGVNNNDGKSPWVQIYGNNSFIEKAFTYARKHAPSTCKLYYNDYNEHASYKRDSIYRTCKSLYEKGLLDGVGMQSHVTANANDWAGGTEAYLNAMDKYLSIGCDVQVTELDVSVKDSNENAQVTKYKTIFQHAVDWNKKHPRPAGRVTLVQVWGPNDGHSWLSSGSNGLLYTSSNQPKAAYNALTSMISKSEWGDGSKYVDDGGEYVPPEPAKVDSDGYWFHYTFESGDEGFSGRGGEPVETSSKTEFGSKSLMVSGRENSWQGPSVELDTYRCEPGNSYSFSTNVMYDSGPETSTFHFTMSYGSGDDTTYVKIATEEVTKGQWTQLANPSFKIPAGADNVHIYVETEGSDIQDFYIDEMIGAPDGTVISGPKAVPAILGDVNCDGQISAADLSAIKTALRNDGKFASAAAKKNADVNKSKKVTDEDAKLIRDYLLSKITDFPQGEIEVEEVDFSAMEAKFRGITLGTSHKKDNENNPLYTQRFGADPGWLVYDGRLYVYTTADEFQYKNGQMIENDYASGAINCLSTADLVNWTDHGQIPVAKTHVSNPIAKWANNAWAPDAAWKTIKGQDKFFLYFANNGSGIGVITADDPTFTKNVKDPLGHELISRSTPNSNVTWLFDPGVYYDPDTDTAIMAYGGGVPDGQAAETKQGRIVQLGDDMISIKGTPFDPGTPYLFEDSSMIKIGDTWYYSFCHNWNVPGGANVNGNSFSNADIGYMTSTNPLGGYKYQGVVFKNTGSQRLDNGGNNHHSIIEFKGSYYVLYHTRQLEMRMGVNGGKGLNYRSPCIDKATISNGKITCSGSQNGVSQLETLNPYETVPAETMSNQSGNISVSGVGNTTVNAKKGDWIKVKGVNFDNGCKAITVRAASSKGGVIKVTKGSPNGEAFAYIEVNGSMQDYTLACNNVEGVTDLCFVFSDELAFDSWSFAAN